MEEIQRLKFQQDVTTGLTYFDTIKALVHEGQMAVRSLKERYISNLKRLHQLNGDGAPFIVTGR